MLECGDSRIIGIEVKASASVRRGDFKGLAALAEFVGGAFERGILFYGGARGGRLPACVVREGRGGVSDGYPVRAETACGLDSP